MFDFGLTELLLIGIVALIVVGPKDLPVLFRRVGEFVGRMKGMAREFTSAMNDAADQAGVKDVTRSIKAAANPVKTGLDKVGEATKEFTNFDPMSETGKLASERLGSSKKMREATAKRQSDKNKSTPVLKSEENKKSTSKKTCFFFFVCLSSRNTPWNTALQAIWLGNMQFPRRTAWEAIYLVTVGLGITIGTSRKATGGA